MKNLLFPTDFSETANNALEFAVQIAKAGGAKIHLLHVYGPPVIDPQMPPGMAAELLTDMEKNANEQLEQLVNVLKSEGVNVDSESVVGFVAPEIAERADQLRTDLIVMGTTGASGVLGKLIGSNTTAVLNECHCPVLLVPDEASFSGFQRMVYASQFESNDIQPLESLLKIARLFDSEIEILKINTTDQIQPDIFNDEPQIRRIIDTFGEDRFRFIFEKAPSVIAGLDKYLEEKKIDILVMSTRRRNFLEKILEPSVTRKMVLHSHTPMLVFHQE